MFDLIRDFLRIKRNYYCQTNDRRITFSTTTDSNALVRARFVYQNEFSLYRMTEFMGWHCYKHVHTESYPKFLKPIVWDFSMGGEE